MAGGNYVFTNGSESQNDATYALIVTVEELLEMIGVVIFIYALSCYYFHHLSRRATVTFEIVTNKQYVFNLGPGFRKNR